MLRIALVVVLEPVIICSRALVRSSSPTRPWRIKEANISDFSLVEPVERSSTRRKHIAIILPKPLLSIGDSVINLPIKGI